jgi:hypothetical protein
MGATMNLIKPQTNNANSTDMLSLKALSTKHSLQRQTQRNISDEMILFVLEHGKYCANNHKLIFLTMRIFEKINKTGYDPKILDRIQKRLPLCIIQEEKIITVFQADKRINKSSGNRKRRKS